MKTTRIEVTGMHCRSCEILLEKSISRLPGVKKVSASQSSGTIEIGYEDAKPDLQAVEDTIKENGYSVGKSAPRPWLSTDPRDYLEVVLIAIAILMLSVPLSHLGLDFTGSSNQGSPTLAISFFLGLTAGVSSCMALVGGLILGISAEWNRQHLSNSRWDRFRPHLLFNIGRILGFALFGGVLGLLGSVFSISSMLLGALTLLVGGIMLLLGINLTDLSPRLSGVSITLPKSLGRNVGSQRDPSRIGTMLTGAMTFFLPCGFTLAMQMYAMSTGSFMIGALALGSFAFGTAPGLIGIGGLTAIMKGVWAKRFFRFAGVAVMLLGFLNIANAYNLLSLGSAPRTSGIIADTAGLQIQEVHMVQNDDGYSPNVIGIAANRKIRWIIDAKSPSSCSSTIVVPSLGITKHLEPGENIIEFVSPDVAEIKFACSMGMYTGKFEVTKELKPPSSAGNTSPAKGQGSGLRGAGGSQGCSMMGGVRNTVSDTPSIGTKSGDTGAPASDSAPSETIKLSYTSKGLSRQVIDLKKGKGYHIVIDVKDTITGCMSQITIPGLDDHLQDLTVGNTVTFDVRPTQSGRFPITCAMGVPHGYLNVE